MDNKFTNLSNFSISVNSILKQKKMTQAKLADAASISEGTISRMCSYPDYAPSLNTVMQVAIGLELSYDEFNTLLTVAYPQLKFMNEVLYKRLKIDVVDIKLEKAGVKPFSKDE